MLINFTYDKNKDIWCLMNIGKKSFNSKKPTDQYIQLTERYGESPTLEQASDFIDSYMLGKGININEKISTSKKDWETISNKFQKIVGSIFNTEINSNITAYFTINSRNPYSIENNLFYLFLQYSQINRLIMHELWHFYTWYSLGPYEKQKLGNQKYNDLKEALTVLINVECKDLLPEGVIDNGYTAHQEIRQKILEYWNKDRNLKNLWGYLTKY